VRLDLVLEPDSPQRFAELGLLAERLGFGVVWTANHISARDPFMNFMALAERSSTLHMGPVAISPYELHPVKITN
jgi:alkanesulfonate monooxygenase SsuD/methylene tetrahydromethanopterin reductase-like flavin-dependent oxidoreductase (luciferase family)